MKSTDLVLEFRPLLLSALTEAGAGVIDVIQAFQSSEQDIPSGPTVFYNPGIPLAIGAMQRKNKLVNGEYVQYERQIEQHSYTFTARYRVDQTLPPDAQYTPEDIIFFVRNTFMRKYFIDAMKLKGIKILRVNAINPDKQLNESDQWESMPNFSISFIYTSEYNTGISKITSIESQIERV